MADDDAMCVSVIVGIASIVDYVHIDGEERGLKGFDQRQGFVTENQAPNLILRNTQSVDSQVGASG